MLVSSSVTTTLFHRSKKGTRFNPVIIKELPKSTKWLRCYNYNTCVRLIFHIVHPANNSDKEIPRNQKEETQRVGSS